MRVHHLSCGTMCPIGALLINGSGGILEPATLICHCLLIETNDGLVLVDTGLGSAEMDNPTERLGNLPSSLFRIEQDRTRTAINQVKALGFDPADVRNIVLTHLDFDHAGGIQDFPHAQIHVLDTEFEVATRPQTLVERNRYCQAQFSHGPLWKTHTFGRGERWFGFDKVEPLPHIEPDILLIPLYGHSKGHCGVAVKEDFGWLLHCGDAIFHHEELDTVEPEAPLGIRMLEHVMKDDIEAFEANQFLLRQLYHENRESIRLVCSHDPKMFDEIPAIPEEYTSAYVL